MSILENIKNLTPGVWIKIVMYLVNIAGLVTLYINTNNVGKDKNCNKYYGSNIAAAVLLALYLFYLVLLSLPANYQILPN
jgi:hypothetical protein